MRRRGPVRVLCAESNQAIGSVFQLFLERAGYEVTLAGDVEHALELLMAEGADLLMTEYRLPTSTGPELISRVRAAGLPLPIVLVIGSLEALGDKQFDQLDVSGILLRPFTQEQLLDVVKKALTRQPGSKRKRGLPRVHPQGG